MGLRILYSSFSICKCLDLQSGHMPFLSSNLSDPNRNSERTKNLDRISTAPGSHSHILFRHPPRGNSPARNKQRTWLTDMIEEFLSRPTTVCVCVCFVSFARLLICSLGCNRTFSIFYWYYSSTSEAVHV